MEVKNARKILSSLHLLYTHLYFKNKLVYTWL